LTKKRPEKTDGLGPLEIKKIRTALRLVWHRSHARRLAVARCTKPCGFMFCEKCRRRTPKAYIDHLVACGDMDGGYIARLFCRSQDLQGLCLECHRIKTKQERAEAKVNAKPSLKRVRGFDFGSK